MTLKTQQQPPFPFQRIFRLTSIAALVAAVVIAVVVALVAFPAWLTGSDASTKPVRLAYVGSLSGPGAEWGLAEYRGIAMLLDTVNAAGGIHGRPLVLETFDDRGDPEEAAWLAERIGTGKEAIAVIGHSNSATSLKAANLYRLYQIPALTASATDPNITAFNDWYFRTVFDDNRQARILTHYLKTVLGHETISVVYANNPYGATLNRVLQYTASSIGMAIKRSLVFPAEPNKVELDALTATLLADSDADAIVLALYPEQAAPLVARLKDRGVEAELVGTDALATNFFTQFAGRPEEQRRTGHYTDGMYLTVPFIYDTANAAARRFLVDYAKRYGSDAPWGALHSYDAASLLVQALRSAMGPNAERDMPAQRQAVREQLAALNGPERAVPGLTGPLFFDADGNVIRPIYVAKARAGILVAASQQLQVIENPRRIEALRAQDENIVETQDALLQITQVVQTGLQLNKLSAIDEGAKTFEADFHVWFRFRGGLDLADLIFPDAVTSVELTEPIASNTQGPEHYQAYHVQATFNYVVSHDNLINGDQDFVIRFYHATLDRNRLVFVTDLRSMGLAGNRSAWRDKLRADQVLTATAGWVVKEAELSQETLNRSTLGNPLLPTVTLPFSTFFAAVRAHQGELSLKRELQELIPPSTFWAFAVAAGVLFVFTWLPLVRRQRPLLAVFGRLILGTVLLYLIEGRVIQQVAGTLEIYQLETLLLFFESLWWLVPAIWINALLPQLVWQPIMRRTKYPVPNIARTFMKLAVYGVAGLCILSFVFERPLTTLLAASGLVTLILGLALQNLIRDAFSGLMLNLERPFKIAHWIQIGGKSYTELGRVEEMNWRTTRILTVDDNLLVVPNGILSESLITNYSVPKDRSRLEIPILLNASIPMERALRILEAGARGAIGAQGPVADPPPKVIVDNRVFVERPDVKGVLRYEIQVRYVVNEVLADTVTTTVMRNVMRHLRQAGLTIAVPETIDIVLDWHVKEHRQELLARGSLFAGFASEDVREVAAQAQVYTLRASETLIRQGEQGDSMYGLAEGLLSVYIDVNSDGKELQVGTRQPGDFLGEMSLLADEPRSATVRAVTDCVVYEIKREVIEGLLRRRPELADTLSRVIAERRFQTSEAIDAATAAEQERAINDAALVLLKKMFKVFGRVLKDTPKKVQLQK